MSYHSRYSLYLCLLLATLHISCAESDFSLSSSGEKLTPIRKPCGIYTSAGSMDSEVANHPEVQGSLIRVMWSRIEPTPNNFDFSDIKRQLSHIKSAHKLWSLGVVAGPHVPAWLYSEPYNIEALNIRFRKEPVKVPKFWDARLQERLALLASALAKEFRDDPSLSLVYLPQMSANGIEGHFNGNSPQDLIKQGFSEELWVQAVMQGAKNFATAFPNKPIAVELHDILGSASAGKKIMSSIEADPNILNQIGVGIWWLSGRTDYQGDLITAFADFKGSIYAQMIDRADRSQSFPSGDFTQAFAQAKALKIRYIEVWEVDAKSHKWDEVIQEFNNYAKTP